MAKGNLFIEKDSLILTKVPAKKRKIIQKLIDSHSNISIFVRDNYILISPEEYDDIFEKIIAEIEMEEEYETELPVKTGNYEGMYR